MIDGKKINHYIEQNKKKKPEFLQVSDEQWAEALDGCHETFSNAVDETTTQEEYWTMIYFSAMYFCKGMDYADILSGKKQPSDYPRY